MIKRKLDGDTLIAANSFITEGKSTVRPVALLISDSSGTEGLWPIEEKVHKLMFKDLKTINFKTGIKLRKIFCPAQ